MTSAEARETEPLPHIKPMQPVTTVDPPEDPEKWFVEYKWDGIRAIVYIDKTTGLVKIETREKQRNVYPQFPEFHTGLQSIAKEHSLILDCELVHREGKRGHGRIATARSNQNPSQIAVPDDLNPALCSLFFFDLLYKDGETLLKTPQAQRKEQLDHLFSRYFQEQPILYARFAVTPYWDGTDTETFMEQAQKKGFEGVVFKRRDRGYFQGNSRNWRRLKFR